jgi:hypothetical protein
VVFVSLHLNSSNGGKPRSSTDYRWHAVMCVLRGSDENFQLSGAVIVMELDYHILY